MRVSIDAAGNLRSVYGGESASGGRLVIGSHLDAVIGGGPYDGVLGVVLGLALVEALDGKRLQHEIEIIGFSEQKGARFGVPFIGSRAVVGRIDSDLLRTEDYEGITLASAIEQFGLDPTRLPEAELNPLTFAFLEFHTEQGPVLDTMNKSLGVVEWIAGRNRFSVQFFGEPSHAGTTPMNLRRDALCGAMEWISMLEQEARSVTGLIANVEDVRVLPGSYNVVPAEVTIHLNMRHHLDRTLGLTIERLLEKGRQVALRRKLRFEVQPKVEHRAVALDSGLVAIAERASRQANCPAARMVSGLGHDAMIVAERVPAVMIFVRTRDGFAEHPGSVVNTEDIDLAIKAGLNFLNEVTGFRKGERAAFA